MTPRMVHRDGFYCDLVYSPDDGGWYLQRHTDDYTSQIFDTEVDAMTCRSIVWTP